MNLIYIGERPFWHRYSYCYRVQCDRDLRDWMHEEFQPWFMNKFFKNWRCDYVAKFSARTEISAQFALTGLKISPCNRNVKRMRTTPMYNNKYIYIYKRFPLSHPISARAEISLAIAFFVQHGQPRWNSPCNQPLGYFLFCDRNSKITLFLPFCTISQPPPFWLVSQVSLLLEKNGCLTDI